MISVEKRELFGVAVVGGRDFHSAVGAALTKLARSDRFEREILPNVRRIIEGEEPRIGVAAEMHCSLNEPTVVFFPPDGGFDSDEVALRIAHEARHNMIFRERRFANPNCGDRHIWPDDIEAEWECCSYEIELGREVGVRAELVDRADATRVLHIHPALPILYRFRLIRAWRKLTPVSEKEFVRHLSADPD